MKPIRSILFVPNRSKPEAEAIAERLRQIATANGVRTAIASDHPLPSGCLKDYDLCCMIGGDGTLLSVVHEAYAHDTAILGVNLGKLGFLATLSGAEAEVDFAEMLEGAYTIQNRAVFKARAANGTTGIALNDVVIKEARGYGLVRLQVQAYGHRISEYHSDGLIFSTPTGSTAYNLSAGGPIVAPDAHVFVMTPICPHTLGNRSVIFDSKAEVTVENLDPDNDPVVSIDGDKIFREGNPFPLNIQIAPNYIKLIQKADYAPLQIVRQKLKWGDPAIRESRTDAPQ